MDGSLLVATHLSSLFPATRATSIPIQTQRLNTPLPSVEKELDPAEHASYSSVLHTPSTGTVLLRVLHGGLIVELVSLSTQVRPLRFVFPSAVLLSPAIFLWVGDSEGTDELHLIAVTTTGSLYRVVTPIGRNLDIWRDRDHQIWTSEYLVNNFSGVLEGLVHVHGTHCVVVGLSNGSLMRLETEYTGTANSRGDDVWTESIFQATSFLSSFKSFLPSLSGGSTNAAEIISMATHPWPTDIGHIWTLSRDRVLRLWKPKIGCVVVKTLSLGLGRESSPSPGKPQVLLDAEHQTLLRVFSLSGDEDHSYVLAFLPAPSTSTFGGSFQVLDTLSEQITEVGIIHCSKHTAHCHLQDFMVLDNVLYTLWDRQGQSMVEKTIIDLDTIDDDRVVWQNALYAPEPELSPAYLEEVLMVRGSMTDKFFDAVMRPGVFSTLTLRTAIDQYTDACLSLPGPPPPQLKVTYASLAENIAAVVGCTVNLNRDPHTGALQHNNYWIALKRDWEGFIARCREIERSARWPLVLGAQGQGDIIVVERERVSSVVNEDLPIHLHRLLALDHRILDPQYDLLSILWTLRHKVGPQAMLNLESCLFDLMHQEIAFPFVDILQDQANKSLFREALDEGASSWLIGRLSSIDNLDEAVRTSLDVVGGLDEVVKREEDEVELLLPPPASDWFRGLTATYITTSTNARYDLCLCLMALLFFLADELSEWDSSLLTEVFAVLRGTATLRYVIQQPSTDLTQAPMDAVSSADDVVPLLQNMQVSRNRSLATPTYSLVHRLLAEGGDTVPVLPGAAHRFLDGTGLLQSVSPAAATQAEVLFCEKLRHLGYLHVSRELLSWLPRTPGVSYVLSLIWLNAGRVDDAALLLEKLAGSFGPDNALSQDDKEALQQVLPRAQLFDSPFDFYIYVATLFKSHSLQFQEVVFTRLALSCAPLEADVSQLWHTIVRGYIDLELFDDAYAAWTSTPSDTQKRENISHLVYRMCETDRVEQLLSFNFASYANEVEEALSFKARNADPQVKSPSYSRILYSWYLLRGDYRNAALTMYQRARKLQALIAKDPSLVARWAGEQLEAYMISINALSLADAKSLWFLRPGSVDSAREKRQFASSIPEFKFSPGKYENEVIQLADIQYEHALLSAQVDLIRRNPSLLSTMEFLLPPASIVLRMAQQSLFDMALATARSLDVDMTDLFAHLTTQCLRLSHNPEVVVQEDNSDWLLTDKVSTWPGTAADRGWRYLRQALRRHDGLETDFKYTKIALETIMSFQTAPPPPWLVQVLEEHHHEYLIRVSLRFGNLDQAVDNTLSLIRKVDAQLARDTSRNASATWLPYTLIDQVLVVGMAQEPTPSRLSELRMEVTNRVKRMQKHVSPNPR